MCIDRDLNPIECPPSSSSSNYDCSELTIPTLPFDHADTHESGSTNSAALTVQVPEATTVAQLLHADKVGGHAVLTVWGTAFGLSP